MEKTISFVLVSILMLLNTCSFKQSQDPTPFDIGDLPCELIRDDMNIVLPKTLRKNYSKGYAVLKIELDEQCRVENVLIQKLVAINMGNDTIVNYNIFNGGARTKKLNDFQPTFDAHAKTLNIKRHVDVEISEGNHLSFMLTF